jgi:hypothetical protein
MAAGLLLISAASLKAFNPPAGDDVFAESAPLLVAGIQLELFVGLWLASGIRPDASRLVGLAVFSGFTIFNCSKIGCGATSCACFGTTMSPWFAFSIDLIVVALLFMFAPTITARTAGSEDGRWSWLSRNWFCIAFYIAVSPLLATLAWRNHPTHDKLPLAIWPTPINLGTLARGEAATGTFTIRNLTHEAVSLCLVETSCPCLSVTIPATVIEPDAQMRGSVRLDMVKEPRFTGNLAMTAQGRAPGQKLAFRVRVDAVVTP